MLGLAVSSLVGSAATADQRSSSADTEGATTSTYNPMADYDQWNVVTFGDTTVSAESEGAVAVGGTLTFHGQQVAMHTTASVRGMALGLLAKNVNLKSSTGELKVEQGSFKVGSRDTLDVLTKDQNDATVNPKAVAKGAGYNSSPDVYAQGASNDASGYEDGIFDSLFSRANAVSMSTRVHDSAACSISARTSVDGTHATVSLTSGSVNYWILDSATLSSLTEIKFEGTTPSATTPLVIDVTGNGDVTFGFTMAGSRDPRGILWNMPSVTSITQTGESVDGSILAPNASYDKQSANIQGTVVTASANLAGSEEHYHPFLGQLADADCSTPSPNTPALSAPTPSPSDSTPVESPTSPGTEPSTSAPSVSESATPSSSTTTPASTSTQPVTSPSPDSSTGSAGSLPVTGFDGAILMGAGILALFGASALLLRRRWSDA